MDGFLQDAALQAPGGVVEPDHGLSGVYPPAQRVEGLVGDARPSIGTPASSVGNPQPHVSRALGGGGLKKDELLVLLHVTLGVMAT